MKEKPEKGTTFIPPFRCPWCNYRMDATTDAFGDATPSKGDVSLCLRCGSIMIFNEDLTVRKPTPEEKEEHEKNPIIMHAQMARAYVVASKSYPKRKEEK